MRQFQLNKLMQVFLKDIQDSSCYMLSNLLNPSYPIAVNFVELSCHEDAPSPSVAAEYFRC